MSYWIAKVQDHMRMRFIVSEVFQIFTTVFKCSIHVQQRRVGEHH